MITIAGSTFFFFFNTLRIYQAWGLRTPLSVLNSVLMASWYEKNRSSLTHSKIVLVADQILDLAWHLEPYKTWL